MNEPTTVRELIEAFGGASSFAKVIDRNPSTASEMKRSGSIRVHYWPRLIKAAQERGIGLSYEKLVAMHATSPPIPIPDSAEAASS